MKNPTVLFGGLGLGIGLMYWLDPDRGKRRRALLRDRARHLSKVANRELNRKANDLRNRAQGVWFDTEKLFESETFTDKRIVGQIRTKLGRLSSHPHAVKTVVENGKVTLSGLILADEVETLLKGIASTCGVREIENRRPVIRFDSRHHFGRFGHSAQIRADIENISDDQRARTPQHPARIIKPHDARQPPPGDQT